MTPRFRDGYVPLHLPHRDFSHIKNVCDRVVYLFDGRLTYDNRELPELMEEVELILQGFDPELDLFVIGNPSAVCAGALSLLACRSQVGVHVAHYRGGTYTFYNLKVGWRKDNGIVRFGSTWTKLQEAGVA